MCIPVSVCVWVCKHICTYDNVGVGGVVLCRCVCDLLIFLHDCSLA